MKTNSYFLVMVLCVWVGCGGSAPITDDPIIAEESSLEGDATANPQLFGVDAHPYGISMKEWAINWMRWVYSIPAATNPILVEGADYNQHQIGPVFFVPLAPNHNDAFTVSRHKALAVMLSQVNNDYPCPDPAFKPAPGQSLLDFLLAGLTKVNDNVTVIQVTLDGKEIVEPFKYRFTSSRLSFLIGDRSLATSFDPCVTGTLQPAVADDFFMLFKPLSRGQHVLTTHLMNADGGVFDRTRTITVE